ncbi:MAG: TfoX/Sxy family protein [Planctomycetota bacterium]
MAYDEQLADRVRKAFGRKRVTEKKMFGGIGWMHRGHMCAGIVKEDLMVRVGPDAHTEALEQPHARPMDFTGKPMKGYVYVSPEGFRSAPKLQAWLERGLAFTQSLPAK